MKATDPIQGAQDGGSLPAVQGVRLFPGASPLLQLSWMREVFRYRNKNYGAYTLRQQYPRRMMWGGLLSIALIALLYGSSLLATALKEKILLMTEYEGHEMTPPPAKEEKPLPPPVITPPPLPARPTITFIVPKVAIDEEVPEEYEPPTQQEMENKNPGTITTDGDPDGVDFVPEDIPIELVPPAVVKDEEPKTPKESVPFIVVEQMPAFRGNLQKYLSENLNYPEIAKENGIFGTVVIQFVVTEKGAISNAFIVKDIGGGCGEEALRVVRSMPPWLPGANRGKQVKVQMSLPVKFRLE